MSQESPPRTHDNRSLRDRIIRIFSSSPSSRLSGSNGDRLERPDDGDDSGLGRHMRDERTRLLASDQESSLGGQRNSGHGTFSPRPEHMEAGLPGSGFRSGSQTPRALASGFRTPTLDGLSVTNRLATEIGVKNRSTMYISYYVPFVNWIRQYRWSFVRGDFIGALTVASFYIPMALSMAENLAHAPPIHGLYSFVIIPLVYAIFGSSTQLIVGPEAAVSLLVGAVVKANVEQGSTNEDDDAAQAQVVGVVTTLVGTFILIAGLTRLGFLDNVLSRPFLRGFITAIGVVIFVDQLIPELGLASVAKGVNHLSTVGKVIYLVRNLDRAHKLTTIVSFTSIAIILFFRTLKQRLEKRFPPVAYFPDRLLVVVMSAILTWKLGWHHQGLDILGPIKPGPGDGNSLLQFRWAIKPSNMKQIRSAMSTSFIIALLGFFESSVAAKGLGDGTSTGISKAPVSANREMIALGMGNLVGGCFMALPSFGGYGRSKVNASAGARTQMSSVFLSLITLIVTIFLLPYLYYLPKAVLSAMISVVAYTLVEELPHDLLFFIRVRGWSELSLMFLIFVATIFYSLTLGMALGCGLSVLSVIRHSTQPRIQILGKVSGTSNQFENAELHPEKVEFIEGCLIVKIPEPLTFANTGDLKNRLRRLEFYGTNRAHPSLPRVRAESDKNVIFDVQNVTSIDASGAQVLLEIVDGYVSRGVRVFFCRLPSLDDEVFRMFDRAGIIDKCGGLRHFVSSVEEALRLTELEDIGDDAFDSRQP